MSSKSIIIVLIVEDGLIKAKEFLSHCISHMLSLEHLVVHFIGCQMVPTRYLLFLLQKCNQLDILHLLKMVQVEGVAKFSTMAK